MQTALACNADWLDSSAPTITSAVTAANGTMTTATIDTCSSSWYYAGYWYPYYPLVQTLTYTTPDPRPIKLTLTEVERLRKAAKDEPKLKAILNKFTSMIEITVDF